MNSTWDAVLSNTLLFLLIFGLSATVNFDSLRQQTKNKRAYATGLCIQYILMPLVGFSVVKLFTVFDDNHNFTPAMGLILLVVTSSPGGSLSNWWCSTFNAELSLSVAFSAVSSIASIALLPANVFLYTFLVYRNEEWETKTTDGSTATTDQSKVLQSLDFVTILITLGLALLAMGLGIAFGYYNDTPRAHGIAHRIGSASGVILIVFSVVLTSGSKGEGTAWYSQDWSLFVATVVPCCFCIVASHCLARANKLTPPEAVAMTIECCYQNMAIALSVAISMFDDPVQRAQAVAVPLVYGIADAVLVFLYCLYAWKAGWTKAPASENICVVISKSYEIKRDHGEVDPSNVTHDIAANVDELAKASESTVDDTSPPEEDVEQARAENEAQVDSSDEHHPLDNDNHGARGANPNELSSNAPVAPLDQQPQEAETMVTATDNGVLCSALELCSGWSSKATDNDAPTVILDNARGHR
jgi:predicted Na+-dependent transporter